MAASLSTPPFWGSVREQLRDEKGCRFGVQLYWTQFRTPEHLGSFARLVGIVLFIWMAVGAKVARQKPSLRMPHPKKSPRQSYVTIGIREIQRLERRCRLTSHMLLAHLLRPNLRRFHWIPEPSPLPMPSYKTDLR